MSGQDFLIYKTNTIDIKDFDSLQEKNSRSMTILQQYLCIVLIVQLRFIEYFNIISAQMQ